MNMISMKAYWNMQNVLSISVELSVSLMIARINNRVPARYRFASSSFRLFTRTEMSIITMSSRMTDMAA